MVLSESEYFQMISGLLRAFLKFLFFFDFNKLSKVYINYFFLVLPQYFDLHRLVGVMLFHGCHQLVLIINIYIVSLYKNIPHL